MKSDGMENSRKGLIIGGVGILALALLVSTIFGISFYKRNKTIKQAEGLVAIEKYEDGIAIYDNLLSKKYSADLMNKRNLAINLMEGEENLEKAIEAYEDGDIKQAVRYLKKISKDDPERYELALEKLNTIEETIIIDIEELLEYENLEEAKELANDYLKIDPKNVKVQNLKNAIDAEEAEIEKQAIREKENQESEAIEAARKAEEEAKTAKKNAEAEAKAIRDSAEAMNTANSIIGSYRPIIAVNANLRNAPSLKSDVLAVLSRGTEVYIHDTQMETSDRIWCHVSVDYYGYTEYGWISYNTLNYKIQ